MSRRGVNKRLLVFYFFRFFPRSPITSTGSSLLHRGGLLDGGRLLGNDLLRLRGGLGGRRLGGDGLLLRGGLLDGLNLLDGSGGGLLDGLGLGGSLGLGDDLLGLEGLLGGGLGLGRKLEGGFDLRDEEKKGCKVSRRREIMRRMSW